MSGRATRPLHGSLQSDGPAPFTTLIELTFQKQKVERWIRFGHKSFEQIIDRRRSIVGFAPGSVFAFVRWASNDYGTIVSRLDILRAVGRGEPFQTVPFVRPGGELLLHIDGWPKVQRVLALIDTIDARGVDPADVAPDYWRHVHNRLIAGQEPNPYTPERHAAWISRRRIAP